MLNFCQWASSFTKCDFLCWKFHFLRLLVTEKALQLPFQFFSFLLFLLVVSGDHVTNERFYIFTTRVPMTTEYGKIVNCLDELLLMTL